MNQTIILGALELGGLFALMSLGLYISYKILDIPDLTVDGSFTLGCVVSAAFCMHSQPYLGLVCGFFAGCVAGLVTSLLITKLNIIPLLSGILTMTALYSINLHILGEMPTVSLFQKKTIFTAFEVFQPYHKLIVIFIILAIVSILLVLFLRTHLGLALRACGDNEDMVRASSIDANKMKMLGLSLANGLVALSGALFTQHQMFADINSGVGTMVIGLASIIIGLTFIKSDKLSMQILGVILGAIFYRFILTIALQFGLPSSDLKLLSAVLVVVALSMKTKRRTKKC